MGTGSALLTALLLLFVPDFYLSEAHILPQESKVAGLGGQLSAMVSTFGLGLPGGDGDDISNMEILKSRWVADELLNTTFAFSTRSWCFGAPKQRRETLYQYLRARTGEEGARRLKRLLTVSRDAKSRLVTVEMETRAPELSQQVVRKAVALLQAFILSKGRTRGGRKALFAEARLAEARLELGKAELAFKDFMDRNRNYSSSPDPGTRIEGARLEMEVRLRQQLLVSIALNRESALLEEKNDLPTLNILDEGNQADEPVSPKRMPLVALAFVAGFLATLGWRHRLWIRTRIRESAALAVKP